MSNLLTVSRMRTWRDCKRKHRLMYIDGWRPVDPGEALRFGTLIHKGLEAWWKADQGERLDAALEAVDGRGFDVWEQIAAEELLKGYDYQYCDDDQYEVLLVEGTFFTPLLNPNTGVASRTWVLAGKRDVFVRSRRTGALLLIEHKTSSENIDEPTDSFWAKLGTDAQVSHYYVGGEGLGVSTEGCLYDVLYRPQQRPKKATPMELRKYVQKTGALYANQREFDETPNEFRARVAGDISDHPLKYFQRKEIARTDKDLVDYLVDTWDESRIMRDAELADRAPRNPEACHRFGQCCFWAICAYGAKPEDHPETFQKVENVHPELELEEALV